jgi:hypothetical protein
MNTGGEHRSKLRRRSGLFQCTPICALDNPAHSSQVVEVLLLHLMAADDSVAADSGSGGAVGREEMRNDRPGERLEIVRPPAGDQRTVLHDFLVDPVRTCIGEVRLQARV